MQHDDSLVWLNNVSLHDAARLHPDDGTTGAPRHSVAVVVSGKITAPQLNPVLGLTPDNSWLNNLIKRRNSDVHLLRFFLCTAERVAPPPMVHWSGSWSFASVSQFDRLLRCLQLVEEHWPKRHSAFLRLRPDALVLGPLPTPLLPSTVALYGHVYVAKPSTLLRMTRDQMYCGFCDRQCFCEQRKYGQVLWHSPVPHCSVITDQVFLFSRRVLAAVLRALSNYTNADDMLHPARVADARGPYCLRAGRMVEVGWSRLVEGEGIPVAPLRLRTLLDRHLQPGSPLWTSRNCILSWDDSKPLPCNGPCVSHEYMERHGGNTTQFVPGHTLPPIDLQGRVQRDGHCNELKNMSVQKEVDAHQRWMALLIRDRAKLWAGRGRAKHQAKAVPVLPHSSRGRGSTHAVPPRYK